MSHTGIQANHSTINILEHNIHKYATEYIPLYYQLLIEILIDPSMILSYGTTYVDYFLGINKSVQLQLLQIAY